MNLVSHPIVGYCQGHERSLVKMGMERGGEGETDWPATFLGGRQLTSDFSSV